MMEQEKIGRFIAELRKEKNMTQEQLAEKLNVTGKSISRWENGKTMPDYSILKDLCEVLGITVNELFTGEKIAKANYQNQAEENLMALRKQIDHKKNVFIWVEVVLAVIIVLMFIGNMILNYIYGDNWDRDTYLSIAWALVVLINLACFMSEFLKVLMERRYENERRK